MMFQKSYLVWFLLIQNVLCEYTIIVGACKSDSTEREKPAFHTSLVKNLYTFSDKAGAALTFEHVWTNIGNGYDLSTGIFTATRTGMYFVMATLYSYLSHHCHSYLYKNDVMLNYGYAGSHNADSNTMHAVVSLQKGDKLFVKHRGGDFMADQCWGLYNSEFSGFMI